MSKIQEYTPQQLSELGIIGENDVKTFHAMLKESHVHKTVIEVHFEHVVVLLQNGRIKDSVPVGMRCKYAYGNSRAETTLPTLILRTDLIGFDFKLVTVCKPEGVVVDETSENANLFLVKDTERDCPLAWFTSEDEAVETRTRLVKLAQLKKKEEYCRLRNTTNPDFLDANTTAEGVRGYLNSELDNELEEANNRFECYLLIVPIELVFNGWD